MKNEITKVKPIDEIKGILQQKLPEFITGDPNKYINSVLLEITKSKADPKKDLSVCTPLSILTAVKQAVDLGLEIDGRKHGHLIKRNINVGTKDNPKWVAECQFQVGYAGFIYAIKRALPDINIVVNLVKQGDIFQINKNNDLDEYTHTYKDPFAGQDKIIGGYCYISFTLNGNKYAKIETMSKQEIDKIKSCAKSTDIWDKWYEEKAKVAIIRRACKILFAGLNNDKLNNLVNKDNEDYDLNQEPKQEPRIINDLPKVQFDEEEDEVECTPEQQKELEEAEKKVKDNTEKLRKEMEGE